MDAGEAARRVLEESGGEALHWTVIWDRALKAGYLNPLEQRDARDELVRWLAQAARAGTIEKTSTGTYRLSAPEAGGRA
ncbi:MAG: HTH domain-containing protein [Actinomycetota bacterium]